MIDLPSAYEVRRLERLAGRSPDKEAFHLLASGACLRLGLIARRSAAGTDLILEAAIDPSACPDAPRAAAEMGLKETFRDPGTVVFEVPVRECQIPQKAAEIWSIAKRT
jgi:hypothetical protein